MTVLSMLAVILGVSMALGNFPQALKIFKRKSAKDVSLMTYLILFIGSAIWMFYGIEISNTALIWSNAIGVVSISAILSGWFLYGRTNK